MNYMGYKITLGSLWEVWFNQVEFMDWSLWNKFLLSKCKLVYWLDTKFTEVHDWIDFYSTQKKSRTENHKKCNFLTPVTTFKIKTRHVNIALRKMEKIQRKNKYLKKNHRPNIMYMIIHISYIHMINRVFSALTLHHCRFHRLVSGLKFMYVALQVTAV